MTNVSAEEPRELSVIFSNAAGQELCRFRAEVAMTPLEQSRGLMFRKSLPAGAGMIFLNAGEEMRYFWMKSTYIPLDIIFIGETGEVKHVHHGAKPLDETTISSRYPVQFILEINAGQAKKCGIHPGVKARMM